MEDKIYVDAIEFERLCRLNGRMDALISYLDFVEKDKTESSYVNTSAVKAIIGMFDN